MRIFNDMTTRGPFVLPIAAVLCAGAVHAQTESLEEIVVTAERRSEDIQKTAASVSVRGGDDLLSQGKYSLQSIIEDIPGMAGGAASSTATSLGGGTDTLGAGLTIRGISSNQGVGGTITSTPAATAIYVDGVYEGVGGGYDIDRVEVLRGPQGTLYGRSATAGVVAIHTRRPALDAFGVNAALEMGNYDLKHYNAALNAPLVKDVLGVRLSGNHYERDGYYNGPGGALVNTDAKAKILYQPIEDLSFLLGFALQNNTDHTGGRSIADTNDPYAVVFEDTPVGEGKNHYRQYWAEANWNMGWATLTYLPALRTWDQDATIILSGVFSATQTKQTSKDDFWTHELRLASNPDSKLIWQAGALYYKNDLRNFNSLLFTSGAHAYIATTEKSTTAVGIFGETTYPFTDRLRLTAGVRYDATKVEVAQDYTSNLTLTTNPTGLPEVLETKSLSAEEGTRDFNNWTYKVRFEQDLTAANLLYAYISTGFSPGDVSLTTCAPDNRPCVIVLEAETLTAYEIGSKNRFFSDTLQVNGAVYYYDYGGYQTAGINVSDNPFNPVFQTLSVPVQSYGFELDMLYQLTAADRIGFNFAYTHARYVDKPALFARYVANDTVSSAIPITANLFYEHLFMLPGGSNLTFHGDARYISARDTNDVTQTQVDIGAQPYVHMSSEVIGNVNATWTSPARRFSVTGYVRNVGDNRYFTGRTMTTNSSLGLPLPSDQWTFTNALYDPRTYGAVLDVRF